jgi:chemotaxis protein CheX
MSFDIEAIADITHDACAMFGLDLVGSDGVLLGRVDLVASIDITGSWSGVVAMGCSAAFAQRLAAAVFELDADELSGDEVSDAFGELVNVAAGHIKALLPSGCAMSVPRVEVDGRMASPESARAQLWRFQSGGDPLAVVVRETTGGASIEGAADPMNPPALTHRGAR